MKAVVTRRRNNHLEEAMALLIQNQAQFLARTQEMERELREIQKLNSERFEQIMSTLLRHERILLRHERLLEALPEAIRQKIGFKPPE